MPGSSNIQHDVFEVNPHCVVRKCIWGGEAGHAPTLPFVDLLLLGTCRNVGEGPDVRTRWGGGLRSLLSLVARQPTLQPLGPPGAAVINALVYGGGMMDVGGLA